MEPQTLPPPGQANELYAQLEPPVNAVPPPAPMASPMGIGAPVHVDVTRNKSSAAYDMIRGMEGLVNKQGQTFTPQHLDGKHLLVYFSAHWCPPCRNFTPKLVQTYESLKKSGREIEVVFVSSDKGESEFNEYLNLMPWLAVPFQDAAMRSKLGTELDVSGIPCLCLFDPNGHLLNRNGVMAVSIDPVGAAFPWIGELDQMTGGMKAMACLACLCCPCLCAMGIVIGVLRYVFCVPCLCPLDQPGAAKK